MVPSLVKVAYLLSHPGEAGVRIRNRFGAWDDRDSPQATLKSVPDADVNGSLERLLESPTESFYRNEALASLEVHLSSRATHLAKGPFKTYHNGSIILGRICYLAVRSIRPRLVMETGVAYGVTSAYILQALEDNGLGRLVSIDLPPLGPRARRWIGSLVPDHLRHRWDLNIGPSQKLLPELVQRAGKVDMFVHDSLHTYAHMRWEFATVWHALQPGGVLIADDISGNRAFEECLQYGVEGWTAIRQEEKDSMCGILRMPRTRSVRA
jgi:hypothetical protein